MPSPAGPAPWLAGLAGAVVFVLRFGAGPAWPGHHAWLLASADSATSWLGWLYFRREAWSLPLGRVGGYLYPDGTTIALTDSLPLLALPGKALAFLLPAGFQYFGGWLLLAHVLQAVFAWLLARRLLPGRGAAAACAGAALLFLSPAFLDRHGHISLSAHWLLLAAFWLYLAPAATGFAPRRVGAWAALTAIACLTHTYLAVMVMALGAAWAARDAAGRTLKPAAALLALAAMAGTALLCWFGVGFLQLGDVAGSSATEYGRSYLNLNFAWNGLGRTLLLPARPLAVENDFEVFNALGLGLLLLVGGGGWALLQPAHRPAWRRHLPLAAVLLGCLLFAQGGQLVLDGRQLATWPLPGWFGALAGPFRASARFVWPWHYGLVLAALALWGRAAPRRLLLPGLLVAALLQTVDLWPLLSQRDAYAARTWSTRLRSPEWDRALADADALLTYPPNLKNTVADDDFIDLAVLALQHDLPTSAGYAARQFQSHREEGVRSLQALLRGRPDPRAPLVLRSSYFAARYPELQDRYVCTEPGRLRGVLRPRRGLSAPAQLQRSPPRAWPGCCSSRRQPGGHGRQGRPARRPQRHRPQLAARARLAHRRIAPRRRLRGGPGRRRTGLRADARRHDHRHRRRAGHRPGAGHPDPGAGDPLGRRRRRRRLVEGGRPRGAVQPRGPECGGPGPGPGGAGGGGLRPARRRAGPGLHPGRPLRGAPSHRLGSGRRGGYIPGLIPTWRS